MTSPTPSSPDSPLTAWQGDITTLAVDAMVTAANTGLRGGGGVDGAVHRAAGPQLLAACRAIGGCPTGSAVITPAFNLGSQGVKHVIHAVGPIYRGGNHNESALLSQAYAESLQLAWQYKCKTIALPAISTGVYAFPLKPAAQIAIITCEQFLAEHSISDLGIVFALFDDQAYEIYSQELGNR